MDADEKALDMVVEGMGNAARRFKAQRWAPKPKPQETAAPAEEPEAPQVSASELERLLTPES